MNLGYDDVIERLIATVETHPIATTLTEVVVVRDLHGRVRLVVRGSERADDREDLDKTLKAELGGWYGGALLSTSTSVEKSLAQHVLDIAKEWPSYWKSDYDDGTGTGNRRPIDLKKWKHIQRVLAKEGWLVSQKSPPPWPLMSQNPTIVVFYSFKGGVGRSTALGIIAWRLAQPQPDEPAKRVVVVDLDLEAPGLDGLFGLDRNAIERGVIDWLLEVAVGEKPKLQGVVGGPGYIQGCQIYGSDIIVVPVGKTLNTSYLEKLARLDFHGSTNDKTSPVEKGLELLLKTIKSELKPDYILLDSRAGFHDIGGLSLTSLAHIDVLVARHTAATEPGLRLTIEMLERCRSTTDQLLVVAQAFATPLGPGNTETNDRKQFRELVESLLPQDAPVPVCLQENSDIARGFGLADIPEATLATAPGYDDLLGRIESLARPTGGGE